MAVPFSNTKLRVPRGFQNLLEGLAKEILKRQPDNIHAFAAIYFDNLLKIREEQGIDPANTGAKHEDRFYNNRAFSKAGNMGDVNDPKQQEAATMIQAAVRGHQARQEVKKMNTDEDKAKEDEAATRIQAVYRGYEARKRVNLLKDEGEDTTEAEAEYAKEQIDIDLDDPDVEKAATKIQASFRGYQTRKTMKDKDKPSEDAEPPGEGVPEGDIQVQQPPIEETQLTEGNKITEEEEIDIDLTDPKVEEAAVKIQGGFKMLKAKKQVEEMKKGKEEAARQEEEQNAMQEKTEEATEAVDIDLNDPDVGKAAKTIQASFRGYQTRKKLEEEGALSQETGQTEVSSKVDASTSDGSTQEGISSRYPASDAEIQLAASKIQAGFKGMMVRKELQKGGSAIGDNKITEAKWSEEQQEEPAKVESREMVTGDLKEAPVESDHQQQGQAQELKGKGEEGAKGEDQQEPMAEEEVDIDLNDPEVEQAALKIQAGFKNFKARKQLKDKAETDLSPEKDDKAETDLSPEKDDKAETDLSPEKDGYDAPSNTEEKEPIDGEAPPADKVQPTEGDTPHTQAAAPPTETDAPPTEGEGEAETKTEDDTTGEGADEKPTDA